jgi:hypothetical protein
VTIRSAVIIVVMAVVRGASLWVALLLLDSKRTKYRWWIHCLRRRTVVR